jgi:hypothetical protein
VRARLRRLLASDAVEGGEVMVDDDAAVVVVGSDAVVETELVLVLVTMVVRESLPMILKISSRTYSVGFTPNYTPARRLVPVYLDSAVVPY